MEPTSPVEKLSPWWKRSVLLVLVIGFAILIGIAVLTPRDAPPIPLKVLNPAGDIVFTRNDIVSGQEVFLRYGLMENGTVWGHGGYLGPDFSAEYLHSLALDAAAILSRSLYGRPPEGLTPVERAALEAEVRQLLKTNRYRPDTDALIFTAPEAASYRKQIGKWADYFHNPAVNRGLLIGLIHDPEEIRQLTSFFAWTAWASVSQPSGKGLLLYRQFPL